MKFGEKLVKLRIKKGITQAQTADIIGISRRTYINYETKGSYPRDREIYKKLADLFECDHNYLLTEDEEFVINASKKYGTNGRREAEKLVSQLCGMFAGGELSEEDRDAVMRALTDAYFECKEENKKYTPKKYRRTEESDE